MLNEILGSFLGIIGFIIVIAILLAARLNRGTSRPVNLDDHPRYGPKRRAGIKAGEVNHANRRQEAEEDTVIHLSKQIPARWYRKAAAGSERHQKLVDDANGLIEKELRIVRKAFDTRNPSRHSPRIHPGTGQVTGGVRRGVYQRPERRNRRNRNDQ